MKRTSFLLIIGILAILALGAYTGYLYWQKSNLSVELERVENKIEDLNEQILQYQNNEVLKAIVAKEARDDLLKGFVRWSRVITDIRKVIPSRENGDDLVEILSYSGSGENRININMKTVAESNNPYLDVADLIEAFTEAENFNETFVPSISTGTDEEGNEILSFTFNTVYGVSDAEETEEPEFEEIIEPSAIPR